ncbi:MAG: hypothetical protein IIW94_03830 [Clostridia bacterium]|nr:hypothetical protein [Clostridia bacterium]
MGKGSLFPEKAKLNNDEDTRGILFFKDERELLQHTSENGAPSGDADKAMPIFSEQFGVSPLAALKNSVNRTVSEVKKAEEKAETKAKAQPEAAVKPKKTSSLLARCMPYIYDEQGVNCAEEKPDYTLESVEEIIESAEKRASEKIARMYNLRTSEVENIGEKKSEEQKKPQKATLMSSESSLPTATKIGDQPFSAAKLFETASFPKVSDTLFNDLTGRRTDIVGEEKVTTAYSEQGGMGQQDETGTRTIPNLTPETDAEQRYEDIISHTRPVNIEDISSSSKKAPVRVTSAEEFYEEPDPDDFKGKKDVVRVGNMLKAATVFAKLRLLATALFTALSGLFLLDGIKSDFAASTLCIWASLLFAAACLVNANVFGGFKGAFTKNSKIELPVALALSATAIYFIYGIISGTFPFDTVTLPLVSLLSYDYCAYRKAAAVFGNFKIVAARGKKTAVTLIGEPSVTSAMARSIISGEVLAAGQTKTDEIADFLKNTRSDKALSGKVNVVTIVSLIAAVFIGVAVGVSTHSIADGMLAATVVLSFSAAPTLFIADIMPFVSMADRLKRLRAAVCSKYSAEQIEQINAVVVSSQDLFPEGTIKLYNMKALSANELDETLALAAAVADVIASPLAPVFKNIAAEKGPLPEADTVKYEDNLGISGWVGDDHVLIGNRSLMIAHGVRVPPLEVDKKLLRQGYFPVYVAVNQRACALMVVGYTVDRGVERKLGRLMDKGITLLIENCDPNISEQMLCDYFAFYPELIKVLDHSGVAQYKKATAPATAASAHGFHRGNTDSFLEILLSSLRLRTAATVLYVIHTVTSVVCWTMFAVLSLGSAGSLAGMGLCLIFELVSAIIALTAYYAFKI